MRVSIGNPELFIPLLDLVETLEEGNRDKDDDRLFSVTDLDLMIKTRSICQRKSVYH